ncbi:hypothetical protein J6590_004387 [Homalodisca vitripennis]|nr:hypothetical protein J6590_004387 [Homalodisca vitripennis]
MSLQFEVSHHIAWVRVFLFPDILFHSLASTAFPDFNSNTQSKPSLGRAKTYRKYRDYRARADIRDKWTNPFPGVTSEAAAVLVKTARNLARTTVCVRVCAGVRACYGVVVRNKDSPRVIYNLETSRSLRLA